MEGMADGGGQDRCFYCALLYPELLTCPRCDNRLHYCTARMEYAERIEREVEALVTQYKKYPCEKSATALLQRVHEIGEPALILLGDAGFRVLALRKHFSVSASSKRNTEVFNP